MRTARVKLKREDGWYHMYNRVAGESGYYPFDDVCKEFMVKELKRLSEFYFVDIVSYCIMGNHYHIVLRSRIKEGESYSREEVVARYNRYYMGKRSELRLNSGVKEMEEEIDKAAKRMTDVSEFMKDFQQSVTRWYNKVKRPGRRGRLWADRFKSTILEGSGDSLWTCVKYIELNPVRAGLVENPAEYRFCSWGAYNGSGEHPFGDNFFRYLRAWKGEKFKGKTDEEVALEFQKELNRSISVEKGLRGDELHEAIEKDGKKVNMKLRLLRRVRYWTDGVVIGSKLFILNTMSDYCDAERIKRKKFERADGLSGERIYSFRRLKTNV